MLKQALIQFCWQTEVVSEAVLLLFRIEFEAARTLTLCQLKLLIRVFVITLVFGLFILMLALARGYDLHLLQIVPLQSLAQLRLVIGRLGRCLALPRRCVVALHLVIRAFTAHVLRLCLLLRFQFKSVLGSAFAIE